MSSGIAIPRFVPQVRELGLTSSAHEVCACSIGPSGTFSQRLEVLLVRSRAEWGGRSIEDKITKVDASAVAADEIYDVVDL